VLEIERKGQDLNNGSSAQLAAQKCNACFRADHKYVYMTTSDHAINENGGIEDLSLSTKDRRISGIAT